jgi:hypothetical protein
MNTSLRHKEHQSAPAKVEAIIASKVFYTKAYTFASNIIVFGMLKTRMDNVLSPSNIFLFFYKKVTVEMQLHYKIKLIQTDRPI